MTEEESISTWNDLERWLAQLGEGWCFRGHSMASWNLEPSLTRRLWRTVRVGTHSVTQEINPAENEMRLFLEFQRKAQQHQFRVPPHDHAVDWLTMMQHYRVPTRLLDWTRSPYVALYFAMAEVREGDAALWAIDLKWFERRSGELLRSHDRNCLECSDPNVYRKYVNQNLLRDDNPEMAV